ncbi:MAG: RimK family alpha-L-glutamate ligase [Pirellulaceae bacterium]
MLHSAPPTRMGILGTPDSPYVIDLQRAAHERSIETVVLRYGDLQASIGVVDNSLLSPPIDTLIVRSMPLGSLEQVIFRMDCLQVWECRGITVLNPPRALETAIDKWLTLHRLNEAGIPVPATIACQSRAAAMEAFRSLGGDVLVKPLFGGEGRGIVRLQDEDTAWRVLGTLQQVGQVLYVQQFAEHFGYDIRVLFIGDRIFSVKRRAAPDQWRTNVAIGGSAEPHRLSETEMDLAQRAATAVGGSILGVDLLPCRDGRLLTLEVNAVPGWRGLGAALNVDIAAEVISHALQETGEMGQESPIVSY